MIANYGYKDGSGEFFISVDTNRCNGCGDCARACPHGVFLILEEDPHDVLREEPVAIVAEDHRNKLRETCSACKPAGSSPRLACLCACATQAISHSW